MKRSLVTLALISMLHLFAMCQTDSPKKPRSFWADFGYGLGNNGTAFNCDFNFAFRSRWLIALRYDGVNQASNLEVASCPDKTNILGGSWMVGHFWEVKRMMLVASVGPGAIDFHRDPCLNTPGRHSTGVGIDISGKVLFPWRLLAVGINPFINFNDVSTYYGMTLNAGIGRFLPRKK